MSLEDWLVLHFNGSPDGTIRVKYWEVRCRFKRRLTRREQRHLHDMIDECQPGWVGVDGIWIRQTEKRPGPWWAPWFSECTSIAPISEVELTPLHFYKPMPYMADVPFCLWLSDEHFSTPDWTEWYERGKREQAKES